MRLFFGLLWFAALSLSSTVAQPMRIVTWQLDDLTPPPAGETLSVADDDRLRQAAAALKSVKPDIVVLYGLGDRSAVRKLAGYLRQPYYHTLGPATFRQNGPGTPHIGQPIVIYSKKRASASRTLEWRTSGRIDLPGGFMFATFEFGTNALSLFCAHWPENLTGHGTNLVADAFAAKRELSAQYLLHHAQWIASTLPDQPTALYVTGNWASGSEAPKLDIIEQTLETAGLKMRIAEGATDRLLATLSNAPPMLNPVFASELDFTAAPELIAKKGFLDPMSVCEVSFRQPASAGDAAGAATRARFRFDPRTFWWSMGAVAATLLLIVLLRTWREQRQNVPMTVKRKANDAYVLELSHGPLRAAEPGGAADGDVSNLSEAVTETTTGHTASWQARALAADLRARQADMAARVGLMPHLSRLMREKLFVWLSSQRSQLLDSHETGTKQVLSLEERLERIQGQFQQRLIAQEERIAELEKEIQSKEKIIRSLHKPEEGADERD